MTRFHEPSRSPGDDVDGSASDELLWQAFRYVAGEMTDDEAEAYEVDLAENASACEAVARAVRIRQCVYAVECERRPISAPVPASKASRSAGRRQSAIIATRELQSFATNQLRGATLIVAGVTLAGLALLWLTSGSGDAKRGPVIVRQQPEAKGLSDAGALVALWRDPSPAIGGANALPHEGEFVHGSDVEGLDEDGANEGGSDEESLAEGDHVEAVGQELAVLDPVPAWLLAAVGSQPESSAPIDIPDGGPDARNRADELPFKSRESN